MKKDEETASKGRRIREKAAEGSFTVETALVMPLILFTMIGILALFFFVHNRAYFTAAVWETALLGSMEEMRENGDGEAAGLERVRERLEMGFYGLSSAEEAVTGGEEIRVSIGSLHSSPVFGFSWSSAEEGACSVLRPLTFVRRSRAAGKETA